MMTARQLRSAAFLAILLCGRLSRACMVGAWLEGYMDAADELETITLTADATCECCDRCYGRADCASMAFNVNTLECKLYGAVASYATLTPDRSQLGWRYYIRHGRSGHHQFCRSDVDCVEDGEFCRAKICTALPGVTCKTICYTLGVYNRYGAHPPPMWGYLGNQTLPLRCRMGAVGGATTILHHTDGHVFTDETLRSYNVQSLDNTLSYSILHLADELKNLASGATYSIHLFTNNKRTTFTVPTDQPAIQTQPTAITHNYAQSDYYTGSFAPCPPYFVADTSLPAMISVDAAGPSGIGAYVQRDGVAPAWAGGTAGSRLFSIYIRE